MKTSLIATLAIAVSSTALAAAETAPSSVVFEEGQISRSLSGVPGDPAKGREIVGSKKLGNCVACHQVTDLSDVPFHGEIGPMLDGAGDRWNEAELRGIIADAKKTFDESMMPSFYKVDGFIRPGNAYTGEAADDTFGPILTAQQIEDVVAYLVTLKD